VIYVNENYLQRVSSRFVGTVVLELEVAHKGPGPSTHPYLLA
jgi:hypothetical protein